jgi:hypothetical protein
VEQTSGLVSHLLDLRSGGLQQRRPRSISARAAAISSPTYG